MMFWPYLPQKAKCDGGKDDEDIKDDEGSEDNNREVSWTFL